MFKINPDLNSEEKEKRENRFLDIISTHKKLFYKICHTYCKNIDDRKDLEQEILIQIWNSLERYDEKYKMSTWLYRIALNTAISFYRKEKTEEKYITDYQNEIISMTHNYSEKNISTEDENSDENYETKINFIYKFMEDLDKVNKALLLLYLDGNTYKEISVILGISETNTATKINRLKNKVKENFYKNQN